MISCDKGEIRIVGNSNELGADLSTIVMKLIEILTEKIGEEAAKEFVKRKVELGIKYAGNVEQLEKDADISNDFMEELEKVLMKGFDELLKSLKKDEEE